MTQTSLNTPFNPAAVIEAPLQQAYPQAWQSTYYYDPARGTCPETEASNIFALIRAEQTNTPLRNLQDFSNRIQSVVSAGTAQIIPLTLGTRTYTYLMTEAPHTDQDARLNKFFGAAATHGPKGLLARIFTEFAARHETGHDIELFEPATKRCPTRLISEGLGDSFALLGLFAAHGQSHGNTLYWFAHQLTQARHHQNKAHYATAPAITGTLDFVTAHGLQSLSHMPIQTIYTHAHTIAHRSLAIS